MAKKKEENLDFDFENAVKENVEVEKVEHNTLNDVIRYGSDEWEDYIISLFKPEELYDEKYPKCSGLRRVGLYLGEVINSGPKQVFVNTDGGSHPRSTVVYEISIQWRLDRPVYFGNFDDSCFRDVRIFSAVADCDYNNAEPDFAVHSVAMAETRAEARCWRKALLLTRTSAEEMMSPENSAEVVEKMKKGTDNEINEKGKATVVQLETIKKFAERVGVDIEKRLNSNIGEDKFSKLEELNRESAATLISEFNSYQQGTEVPKEFKN